MKTDKRCGPIVFIREDGEFKFLLVKNEAEVSSLLFTHQREGESDLETARRELHNITGLEPVKIYELDPINYDYQTTYDGKPFHRQLVFFVVEVGETELEPQQEEGVVVEYGWATIEAVRDSSSNGNVVDFLQQALAVIETDD